MTIIPEFETSYYDNIKKSKSLERGFENKMISFGLILLSICSVINFVLIYEFIRLLHRI